MAIQTFTRLYDDHDDAVHIVQALGQAGIPYMDISLVASNVDAHHGADGTSGAGLTSGNSEQGASTGGGTGAALGTVLGGGAGLLAGLGMLSIPGVWPIVAAGWLVATLAGAGVGAAAGGLFGSLTGAGVSEADAHTHSEGVRRGGSLVTVRADGAMTGEIDVLLDSRTPVDPAVRRTEYENAGWTSFDPAVPAYTTDQVVAARRRRVRVSRLSAVGMADALRPTMLFLRSAMPIAKAFPSRLSSCWPAWRATHGIHQ